MEKLFLLLVFYFTVSSITAQFPEGFETTVPPTGWAKFVGANNLGAVQDWQATNISNTGTQAAYVRYENVSGGLAEDWLVTPQFTPTSTSNLLSFMQRQSYTTDYGSAYSVRISTGSSQTTHADFIVIDSWLETDFTYYYTLKEIDLSAYLGVPVYVAFVMTQDDGDNWLVDDVTLTGSATCIEPSGLLVSSLTANSAVVDWTPSGTQVGYNVRLYQGTDNTTTPVINTTFSTGTLTSSGTLLNNLNDDTYYYFEVESDCGNGDVSSPAGIGFKTNVQPIIPHYVQFFSDFPGNGWSEAIGSFSSGPTGTTSDWQSDLYSNTSGDTSAKINLYFSNSNHWLISPFFNLSGGEYELTMDVSLTEWNLTTPSNMGSDDQVDLLITEDGITWTSLYTWNNSNKPSNTGSTLPPVDLSSYTGNVQFAFLASDGTVNDVEDYDFFVDDFEVRLKPCVFTSVVNSNAVVSSDYCTDNGWHNFYNNGELLLSIQGDLTGAATGFPQVTINDNGSYHQTRTGSSQPAQCSVSLSPGEELFEMSRYWNVDFGGGTLNGSYDVRFYYSTDELTAIENAAANWMNTYSACGYSYKYQNANGFYWFKNQGTNYTGPEYDGLHLTGSSGVFNGLDYVEFNGITSFSGGSGAISLVPNAFLPVQWLYFDGETLPDKSNKLSWATESEFDTDYFNVQRSSNGMDFETIGVVAAEGNSTTTRNYFFTDEAPLTGYNYYRLELMNIDGKIDYSQTISLSVVNNNSDFSFFPNPTENSVNYQFTSDKGGGLKIDVSDVLGRNLVSFVRTCSKGVNNIPLDLNALSVGSYLVRVEYLNSSVVHNAKIVKSKF